MADREINIIRQTSICPHCGHEFDMMMGEHDGKPGSSGAIPVAICTVCFKPSLIGDDGVLTELPEPIAEIVAEQLGPALEQLYREMKATKEEGENQ